MKEHEFFQKALTQIAKNPSLQALLPNWQSSQKAEDTHSLESFLDLFDNLLTKKKLTREYYIKTLKLKKPIYHISLFYNIIKNKILPKYPWWSKITDDLYLGALPLEKHKNELLTLGIESVVSLVESFETRKSILNSPISFSQWKTSNVENIHISVPDFGPVPLTILYKGANAIHDSIQKGLCCYVHCKAGRGRSAASVVSYLCLFNHMSPEKALNFVKEKRSFIDLNNKFEHIIILWRIFMAFKTHKEQKKHQEWVLEKIRNLTT